MTSEAGYLHRHTPSASSLPSPHHLRCSTRLKASPMGVLLQACAAAAVDRLVSLPTPIILITYLRGRYQTRVISASAAPQARPRCRPQRQQQPQPNRKHRHPLVYHLSPRPAGYRTYVGEGLRGALSHSQPLLRCEAFLRLRHSSSPAQADMKQQQQQHLQQQQQPAE